MTSEDQERNIENKIRIVVKAFLETPLSNAEISKKTGISKSSVQRYLNDERIIEIYGKETYDNIQKLIKILKQEALRKGGITSTTLNESIKDEHGKFNGSRKR